MDTLLANAIFTAFPLVKKKMFKRLGSSVAGGPPDCPTLWNILLFDVVSCINAFKGLATDARSTYCSSANVPVPESAGSIV